MKPLYPIALALLNLLLPTAARADNWGKISTNGFGTTNNIAVERGISYNDGVNNYAYFTTQNSADGAQVWRSSDGVTWNQANASGFDVQCASNTSAEWLTLFNGAMYAGTASADPMVTPPQGVGGRVYRSPTGLAPWTAVFSTRTTGLDHNIAAGGAAVVFNNTLFIGTKNQVTGAEIWKSTSANAETSWTQVSTAGFGMGAVNANIAAFLVYAGALYAATNSPMAGTGQIWRTTDGNTWTQVVVASKTFSATTQSISQMISFNNNFFVGTLNSAGAQIWHEADPTTNNWSQVFSGDGDGSTRFSVAASSEIHSMAVANGFLYAGTWDPTSTAGTNVYHSTDGVYWINSNASGFGAAANQMLGGFVSTGPWMYASTRNDPAGGAVWRALAVAPSAPALTGVAVGTGSITWSWTASNYADGYNLINYYGLDKATLSPSTLSDTLYIYSTNTVHQYTVAAVNSIATSTSAAAGNIYTLAGPSSGTALVAVYGTSFTVTWSLNTNSTSTAFAVQYGTPSGSTNTFSAGTSTVTTVTGLIGGTTYFLDVVALNGNNIKSAPDVTLATSTVLVTTLQTTVNANTATLLGVNMSGGTAFLSIPANAFNTAVNMTIQPPQALPATTASAAASLQGTGAALEIDLNPSIQPASPVTLTVPYTAAEGAGFDPAKLLLARYDPNHGIWVPLPSISNPSVLTVTATTPHLSTFQIMATVPPTSVGAMTAFPNPLRPSIGQTQMTFSNVPASARIRIYDVAGELVREIIAGSSGIVGWDGTNRSGNPAASGVYFVLVQSAGRSRTYKVAIER